MGNNYLSGFVKIAVFILILGAVVLGVPQLSPVLFPDVGEPAADYDCDDETLDMYRHFQDYGIESTPVVGNLDITGETIMESNHIWLLVGSGENKIAYDWGMPRFDRQHYEGYKVSHEYLLYAVYQDGKSPELLGIAESK